MLSAVICFIASLNSTSRCHRYESDPEMLEVLAVHFLAQQRSDVSFTSDALELLMGLTWPGNVRELRNVITKVAVFAHSPLISAEDLRPYIIDGPTNSLSKTLQTSLLTGTLSEMEHMLILKALESTGGNQSLAAAHLGVPRRTFCRKLNEYHITLGRRQRREPQASSNVHGNRRTALTAPVTVQTNDGERVVAEATDLSMGGMGLRGVPAALTVEAEVTLICSLVEHEQPFLAKASVAWLRSDGSAGMRFTSLSSAARKILGHWMEGRAVATPPPFPDLATAPSFAPNSCALP